MFPSPLLATGSKVSILIEESIPRAALMLDELFINAATEVTGVMTLKSS